MEKVICLNCGKFVEYMIKESNSVFNILGEDVKYKKRAAYCKCCNNMVWAEEVDNYNANAPIEQYCKDHDLITASEIIDLSLIGKQNNKI